MPEGLEIELYRRLADLAVGRRVTGAELFEDYGRGGLTAEGLRAAVRGTTIVGTRRRGKLLLLDLERTRRSRSASAARSASTAPPARSAPSARSASAARMAPSAAPDVVLGVRFGMTGTLELDGQRGVDELVYSSQRREPAWVRFSLRLSGGGSLLVRDPRRLGSVELDPDLARLGPDAATVSLAELRAALGDSVAPLKARLMDQARLAGLGNLLADEILWRAALAPGRPAGSLKPVELRRLHRHLQATMTELLALGGSHLGRLMPDRQVGGRCPRDAEPLVRTTVGGRTSYWCPRHQR